MTPTNDKAKAEIRIEINSFHLFYLSIINYILIKQHITNQNLFFILCFIYSSQIHNIKIKPNKKINKKIIPKTNNNFSKKTPVF